MLWDDVPDVLQKGILDEAKLPSLVLAKATLYSKNPNMWTSYFWQRLDAEAQELENSARDTFGEEVICFFMKVLGRQYHTAQPPGGSSMDLGQLVYRNFMEADWPVDHAELLVYPSALLKVSANELQFGQVQPTCGWWQFKLHADDRYVNLYIQDQNMAPPNDEHGHIFISSIIYFRLEQNALTCNISMRQGVRLLPCLALVHLACQAVGFKGI